MNSYYFIFIIMAWLDLLQKVTYCKKKGWIKTNSFQQICNSLKKINQQTSLTPFIQISLPQSPRWCVVSARGASTRWCRRASGRRGWTSARWTSSCASTPKRAPSAWCSAWAARGASGRDESWSSWPRAARRGWASASWEADDEDQTFSSLPKE